MTTKLKILLIINFIIVIISKFIIPLFTIYMMYGAQTSTILFYIVVGLLSMWLGPKIIGLILLWSLNDEEIEWLKKEYLIINLKDRLGL